MSTEYVWNKLRVRRSEDALTGWQYYYNGWFDCHRVDQLSIAAIAELDKKFPLPLEPPEPGTIVHLVGSDHWGTAAMTFIGVDPDDSDMWIVRDGRNVLDGYAARWLALGAWPGSDDR